MVLVVFISALYMGDNCRIEEVVQSVGSGVASPKILGAKCLSLDE